MSSKDQGFNRADTDASLRVERQNADQELARRIIVTEGEADEVLRIARERADRLLEAARAAADLRLPLSRQTEAAALLLLDQRDARIWRSRAPVYRPMRCCATKGSSDGESCRRSSRSNGK